MNTDRLNIYQGTTRDYPGRLAPCRACEDAGRVPSTYEKTGETCRAVGVCGVCFESVQPEAMAYVSLMGKAGVSVTCGECQAFRMQIGDWRAFCPACGPKVQAAYDADANRCEESQGDAGHYLIINGESRREPWPGPFVAVDFDQERTIRHCLRCRREYPISELDPGAPGTICGTCEDELWMVREPASAYGVGAPVMVRAGFRQGQAGDVIGHGANPTGGVLNRVQIHGNGAVVALADDEIEGRDAEQEETVWPCVSCGTIEKDPTERLCAVCADVRERHHIPTDDPDPGPIVNPDPDREDEEAHMDQEDAEDRRIDRETEDGLQAPSGE